MLLKTVFSLDLFVLFYESESFACMRICTVWVPGTCGGPKRASDSLDSLTDAHTGTYSYRVVSELPEIETNVAVTTEPSL